MSTVRRPAAHTAYIREVSKQTRILLFQGFLFFGTIAHVEDKLRSIVDNPNWRQDPVRFLVVDLTLVAGVGMSSANNTRSEFSRATVSLHVLKYTQI